MELLIFAAQGAESVPDGIFSAILGGGGVMGAVFLMQSFGWGIHSNDAYKNVQGERDRALVENAQLKLMLSGQIVPTLTKNVDVIQANNAKEDALMDRLDELAAKIEAVGREKK